MAELCAVSGAGGLSRPLHVLMAEDLEIGCGKVLRQLAATDHELLAARGRVGIFRSKRLLRTR